MLLTRDCMDESSSTYMTPISWVCYLTKRDVLRIPVSKLQVEGKFERQLE